MNNPFNRFARKAPPVGVSKIGPVSTDRNVAQVTQPSAEVATVDGRTLIQTYFTSLPNIGDDTPILYNGDRLWARITLTLETAGPVVVGTQSNIGPVLSGKGQLLDTGVPVVFDIMKGTRLYILATGVNRVKFVTAPIPWLEMITGLLGRVRHADKKPTTEHSTAPTPLPIKPTKPHKTKL